MKVINHAKELGWSGRPVCLAIGVFDGVHLGHQQIVRQTVANARQHEGIALVVTFNKHPSAIVAPDHVPLMIYSQQQKERAIASLGTDALLVIQFDEEFSKLTGEHFIRSLALELGRIENICVGADFVFGHKRSGNVALLKELGRELGFHVHGLAAVAFDRDAVSSTRIREFVRSGRLDHASQMLGRPYSISGLVVHGDHLGHNIGFPTANLDTTGMLLPESGVYSAHATIGGTAHRAVLNIGNRPTLQHPKPETRLEVHLLDFSGDLYGEELEITFVARLRNEVKFSSLDELKSQIGRDIDSARNSF